jgi:hypothetical protein
MLAVVGCTSPNPAFEGTGEASGVDPDEAQTTTTTGASTTTTTTGGSSDGSSVDLPTSETSETSGVGSEDVPQWAGALCDFDLVAINDLGELYALDPDAEAAELLLVDPRLASWALATDPATGVLYVNEQSAPGTVWRVDPFAPAIEDEPLAVDVAELDNLARATIHPTTGHLWLGTDDTHRFLWLPLTGGSILGDHTVDSFAWGGDMVFLDERCAVVPALDGALYHVCFPGPPGPPPTLTVDMPPGAQFTGVAIDGQDRMWLSTADPVRTLIHIEREGNQWAAATTVFFEMPMNDLATLVDPPGC